MLVDVMLRFARKVAVGPGSGAPLRCAAIQGVVRFQEQTSPGPLALRIATERRSTHHPAHEQGLLDDPLGGIMLILAFARR